MTDIRLAGLDASGRRLQLAGAFLAGLLAALGQAPFGLWPATVAGLALGHAIWQQNATPGKAFLPGLALGAGYFILTLSWLVNPFFVEPWRHGWMAPFALAGMAVGLGLFWAVAGSLARSLTPATKGAGRGWGWLSWAMCLSAAEMARGWLFTGFPWGGPGLIWLDTPIAQLAAYVGVTGLSALTFSLAAALATLPRSTARLRNTGLVLIAMALVLFASLPMHRPDLPADRPERIRLVQPNAPQHLKWDPRHAPLFLERQIDLTAAPPIPSDPAPDLTIWPETSVPYLMDLDSGLFAKIAKAASGRAVALGIQRGEGLRFYNSLVVLDGEGQVTGLYDKHHLVPFGEYIPFGDMLQSVGIRAFAAQLGRGYSAGPGAQMIDMGALGTVLPLICYEAIFPRDIHAAATHPDWLLQVTNDAWFGGFSGPQQHLAQARFRAIEFGLPMVRVANTGISAVIDARGNMRASIPLGQHGWVDHNLPGALPQTAYARFGDLPLTLFLISAAMALLSHRSRGVRVSH